MDMHVIVQVMTQSKEKSGDQKVTRESEIGSNLLVTYCSRRHNQVSHRLG